jgi:hypothetical protein
MYSRRKRVFRSGWEIVFFFIVICLFLSFPLYSSPIPHVDALYLCNLSAIVQRGGQRGLQLSGLD